MSTKLTFKTWLAAVAKNSGVDTETILSTRGDEPQDAYDSGMSAEAYGAEVAATQGEEC